MATMLLCEKMGTKFIINALSMRFRRCLDEAATSGVEYDLAGCRFGPECADLLKDYYDRVNFCNTEDSYLDGLLKNNMDYKRNPPEEYELLTIRNMRSLDDYFDLAENLPQGGQFKVDCSLTSIADRSILVLLIMTRPDLELDIRQCSHDVFTYVRDSWLSVAEHHDKYYELIPPDVLVVEKQPDSDYYGRPSYGLQREQAFIRNRLVLPYEFGNSQIITLDQSIKVSQEWRLTVEKCIDAFEMANMSHKPGKVLRNILTFREDI